jgi:SAM-dependent methyltransferase
MEVKKGVAWEKKWYDRIHEDCEAILNVGGRDGELREFFKDKKGYKTLDINPLAKPDIVGSAYELPFPDGSLDAIINFHLLEHLETPHVFVQEIERVLKPGGYVYACVPFMHPYHGGINAGTYCPDYYRYTKDGLAYLFRDFEITLGADGGFFTACKSFFPSVFHPLFALAQKV